MLAKALASATAAAPRTYVEDVFSTWLYTGNGSTQTITNGIDLSGKGGLVWIKSRSAATENILYDTSRGPRKYVQTQSSAAESTTGSGFGLTAFNATGFDLGFTNNDNNSSTTYASWTFRKAAKFFDVVTYVGDGTNNRQIAHNLGSVPGCIIVKRTNSTANWAVYHRGFNSGATTGGANLNTTGPFGTEATFSNNNTPFTSTYFLVSNTVARETNGSGDTYVAYLFAHDAGGFGDSGNESVVSCGSFTQGAGSTSINLGWEPQFVIAKRSDATGSWAITDVMRGMSNTEYRPLLANNSNSEADYGGPYVVPTATGFTALPGGAWVSGSTVIYIAIRRGPMKTPTDATKVFSASLRTGTGSVTNVTSLSFPTDLLLPKARSQAWYALDFYDRLRGSSLRLDPSAQSAEGTPTAYPSAFLQNGYTLTADANGYVNFSGESYIDLNFRRAPGFFDVVGYAGTGSTQSISHNLSVVPEMIIVKSRSSGSTFWMVYHPALGKNGAFPNYITLNEGNAKYSGASSGFAADPTSSVFTVGAAGDWGGSGQTYIAYLFATCPGVSKVGSYTGSGTTKQIDCGFTAGARFVLIKRTDSTGDWYVWDTARGIISGNDPYLLINSSAAEVTGTDYIDPLNSGFEISSTAPAAINANGGSFIFLAIA